jgi:hypothetical protein
MLSPYYYLIIIAEIPTLPWLSSERLGRPGVRKLLLEGIDGSHVLLKNMLNTSIFLYMYRQNMKTPHNTPTNTLYVYIYTYERTSVRRYVCMYVCVSTMIHNI